MKKLISFPSIDQFKTLVSNINRQYNYVGLDDKGEAIYDHSKPKPYLTLMGTVKLHGSNFSVCFNNIDGFWVQSRSNIITPQSDNAGSAFFAESKKDILLSIINEIATKYNIDLNTNTITVYSEWAGKGIQKGVGITNVEKSMFIFAVKISPIIDANDVEAIKNNPAYWVNSAGFRSVDNRIYNIEDFKTYSIEVDFNTPQLSQNKIIEMTLEVEEECPVAKSFGFPNTIGEGIVFSLLKPTGERLFMKSKGEKHAGKSKVKTLHAVDDEKIKKQIEIAEKVTPTWRLEQMLTESCDLLNGGSVDNTKLGGFIRLVINDVLKEELSVISEAGLYPKEINKHISDISRKYFFMKQNEEVGLK